MSEVFYRKYRPQKFDEVAGQSRIVQALKNALAQDKIAHAYLFSGPRGTGKTTLARILAKSVGCNPEDTIEIDGASQRGIDEARELREGVRVLPFSSPKKAYIIDEVHMLTREAFNALLKTLEEPPEHVLFVLATTEISKVPETIISRTQHFEFAKIPVAETIKELKKISKKEDMAVSDDALGLMAFFSDGSLRDAENILFQLSGLNSKSIEEKDVRLLLGAPKEEQVNSIVSSMFNKDSKTMLENFSYAINSGINPSLLGKLILRNVRASLFLHLDPTNREIAEELSAQELEFLKNLPKKNSIFFDFALREILTALSHRADDYTAHIPLELALIKITTQTA
ncbi:MAG: DNA polymerase III subunit gamma/tau [Patescibacteria group bacterium]